MDASSHSNNGNGAAGANAEAGQTKERVELPRLACHFQKRYPAQHAYCGSFRNMYHLKKHLQNCHEAQNEGLSPTTSRLVSISRQPATAQSRWYKWWDVFFPGIDRPATHTIAPFLSDGPSTTRMGRDWEILAPFCTFLEIEGPDILLSCFDKNELFLVETSFEHGHEDGNVLKRRVISEAFRQIMSTWDQKFLARPHPRARDPDRRKSQEL